MAASELEIEPDLNKAPPHVEGELLKQNAKALVGKKGWRKYYFIVLNDKLQYFRKREDCKSGKEPIANIRMSQVTEITEVIFNFVPRDYHLNCGFSVVAFQSTKPEQQLTLNLLAETPENMRYWVHALRYIKAYWSKMKIRDTIISDDQERKILERILSEEEDEREDDLIGQVTLDEDGQSLSLEDSTISIMLYFANGMKTKVNLLPTETTSDLLDRDEVKVNFSSSASYLWMVDHHGDDFILDTKDTPALYLTKAKRFYALDHSYRVLVVFHSRRQEFEIVTVSSQASASDILDDKDLCKQLDKNGIDNRALFLKTQDNEHIFTSTESPCDLLFELDDNGVLIRRPVGTLFVRNKALGGGRKTAKLTQRIRTTKKPLSKMPSHDSTTVLKEIAEVEEAQANALNLLMLKKNPGAVVTLGSSSKSRESWNLDDDWVIPEPESRERGDSSGSSKDSNRNSRSLDEAVPSQPQGDRSSSLKASRPRAAAIDVKRGRSGAQHGSPKLSSDRSRLGSSPTGSPRPSPTSSPKHDRSRSKSPRRLPDIPPQSDEASPSFRRRGASRNLGSRRGHSNSTPDSPKASGSLRGKGPTILLTSVPSNTTKESEEYMVRSPTTKRARSPSIRNVFENVTDSRSSSFGITTGDQSNSTLSVGAPSPAASVAITTTHVIHGTNQSAVSVDVGTTPKHPTNVLPAPSASDEKRLEEIFSRTFQQEQEELNSRNYRPKDTLTEKVRAYSGSKDTAATAAGNKSSEQDDSEPPVEPLRPMVIDFTKLQSPTPDEVQDEKTASLKGGAKDTETTPITAVKPMTPISVSSPSLLKVILLQSSEASDSVTEVKPVDFISLSGVCLMNNRGIWRIQEGCNFHDPLPFDCDDHTESFPLPGGIRAIYNHTHKRWHVLPPPATPITTPSGDDSGSMIDSASYERHSQSEDGTDGRETSEDKLYATKKMIVTEIGSAFHEIMIQFEKSRDLAEKKRIGSDMTNIAIGHMIRGRFCSSLAALILDGLRPYRLEGLVTDDIWKVTAAFCNEAHASSSSSVAFPAFDRQILQPINALKTLMKDNNVKFRTFICLAMSKGMLTAWLEALPKQKNILKKYYVPTSFLRLASDSELIARLYQQMLLTLEPMLHLPFDLSIDFEARQAEEARHVAARQQQEQSRAMASPVPQRRQESSPEGSPQMRPSVVIKTHAATGQRSGNVISAVWDKSPVHGAVQTEATVAEETDGSNNQLSSIKALRDIESKTQQKSGHNLQPSMESVSRQVPTNSAQQSQQPQQQQAPPTRQQGSFNRSGRGSWLRKMIDDGIQQLNLGGAFTGTPKQSVSQQQQQVRTPPKSSGSEMRVEALYNNIGEDADELSFTRGDVMVVKEQINAEWLICELGTHSGIVPANYVKTVS